MPMASSGANGGKARAKTSVRLLVHARVLRTAQWRG